MKSLDDYLKLMKTDDIVRATQEARTKNMALLNDQGIAAIAMLFSDVLAEVIQSGRRRDCAYADSIGKISPSEKVSHN